MNDLLAKRKSLLFGFSQFVLVAITAVAALATSGQPVLGQEPTNEEEAVEGQLWNITKEPFTFQLRQASGPCWTEEITLQPGEYKSVLATETNILGITNDGSGDGYVIIRYPALGGSVHTMLSARTRNDQFVPYWFYVEDANGFGRMVQAKSREEAEARQTKMLAETPKTPEEMEELKLTFRANWVLYEE